MDSELIIDSDKTAYLIRMAQQNSLFVYLVPPLPEAGAFRLPEDAGSSFSFCSSSLPILLPLTASNSALQVGYCSKTSIRSPDRILTNTCNSKLLIKKSVALSLD